VFIDVPPPPPDMIKEFYKDTIEGKALLTKYDTLAYPYKISVLGHKAISNKSLIDDYFSAFEDQNEIRIRFVCENIIISDSLLIPTSSICNKIYPEGVLKKYSHSDLTNLSSRYFSEKPMNIRWDEDKLADNSIHISDLKSTEIKCYRVFFNESLDQGLLIANVTLHGYMSIYAYFIVDKNSTSWSIIKFQPFWFIKNDKRWTRQ
jgi:hypothetical protein